MKKDNLRKWMWLFLMGLGGIQMYAVRELLAAFAIFMLGFGAIAVCAGLVYFLHKALETAVTWAVESRHPVFLVVRRSVAMVEDLARRQVRRPGSEPAA